ncbi:MAG: hypothetical protein WCB27_16185 [Thermoguttaceae bacterium]|jgi:hypothetical protein
MKREEDRSKARPGLRFELHRAGGPPAANEANSPLPWRPCGAAPCEPALTLGEEDGLVWVGFDQDTGDFTRRDQFEQGCFGLKVCRRHFASGLAVLAGRSDVLVNALPGLSFSVLKLRDSLVVGSPGHFYYVTARFTPYIGPPTPEMIGKRCPVCKIPIQAAEDGQPDTRVITCRCGAVLHWETPESHPDVPEEDRLGCLAKATLCPCCQHELSSQEVLVWDPATI